MRRFQPALLGGLFIGILSSLPIVGAANYCCCLWVVLGGFLTVYLQRQNAASGPEVGEAVLGGLIAGLVGAVIYLLFSLVLFSVSRDLMLTEIQSSFDSLPQLPAETRDRVMAMVASGGFVFLIAVVVVPTYAVFSVLGALLGVAVFRKKPTPPAPPVLES